MQRWELCIGLPLHPTRLRMPVLAATEAAREPRAIEGVEGAQYVDKVEDFGRASRVLAQIL